MILSLVASGRSIWFSGDRQGVSPNEEIGTQCSRSLRTGGADGFPVVVGEWPPRRRRQVETRPGGEGACGGPFGGAGRLGKAASGRCDSASAVGPDGVCL